MGRRRRGKSSWPTFPCVPTKSINLVCSSEHVGQQCPLREQPRRTSLRPLFRPRFHVAGVPRVVPVVNVANNIVARNYPGLPRYTKGSPARRPLLKDPEEPSSKFATRQVASSRMALPASSSGDEVEGSPSGRQGGWVTKFLVTAETHPFFVVVRVHFLCDRDYESTVLQRWGVIG